MQPGNPSSKCHKFQLFKYYTHYVNVYDKILAIYCSQRDFLPEIHAGKTQVIKLNRFIGLFAFELLRV